MKKIYSNGMRLLDFILDVVLIVVPIIIWYYRGTGSDVFPSTEITPPEDILPSEAGYIMTGRVENSALGALIINWAEQGYIKINCTENYRLEKVKDIPYSARSYEIFLFDKLFNKYGDGKSLDWKLLSPLAKNRLKAAKRKIIKHFTTKAENRIFSADGRPFVLLVGLIATLPVAKLIFIELFVLGHNFRFGPLITSIINLLILVALYFISATLARPALLRSRNSWKFILTIFILVTALAVGFTAFWIIGGGSGGFRYVFAMISSFIVIVVLNLMTQRTSDGNHLYEHCLGFRNYILNTDRELINRELEETPDIYIKHYAFASALEVSQQWSEHFVTGNFPIPEWCIVSKDSCRNAVDFNKLMLGLMKIID